LPKSSATPAQKANTNFFTSGSREADQRASQRMAQTEQLSGAGEGYGEKGVKKAPVAKAEPGVAGVTAETTNKAAQSTEKLTRQEPKFAGLSVVMVTGSAEIQDEKTAYQLGANWFMVKSLDFVKPTELSRTVTRLIPKETG